jgi:GntR family transcriptional repressor for pyruvate dehydrogenase complex
LKPDTISAEKPLNMDNAARALDQLRPRLDHIYREHVRIFDAIRAGDALAARTAARWHLQSAAARLNLDITSR